MDNKDKEEEKEKLYISALNNYYKLKNEYEEAYQKDIKRISSMKALSWKEKRIEFQKIKRKCINCHRPVGTLFTDKAKEIEDKHLLAVCGDRVNPCPLNIDINTSYVVILPEFMADDEKTLNEYKKQIVIDKNDLLFGYISSEDAIKKFDELKEQMISAVKNYEFESLQYYELIDNPKKMEELKKQQKNINDKIVEIKLLMREYDRTQNTQYVADAVASYISMSFPPIDEPDSISKLAELMDAKYAYNAVEYNDVDGTYHLIQKVHTISEYEQILGEKEPGVVAMVTGVEQKIKRAKKQPVLKTKKPTTRFVVESDDAIARDEVVAKDEETEQKALEEDSDEEPIGRPMDQPIVFEGE
jgi:hypothetical protein